MSDIEACRAESVMAGPQNEKVTLPGHTCEPRQAIQKADDEAAAWDAIDTALAESFPASDPPSFTPKIR